MELTDPISHSDFGGQITQILVGAGIETVGELRQWSKSELEQLFRRHSIFTDPADPSPVEQIEETLAKHNLQLRQD